MNDILKAIALKLGLRYNFGTYVEFDDFCTTLEEQGEVIAFYECYDDTLLSRTSSGRVEEGELITVFLVMLSETEEAANIRLPKIEACKAIGRKFFVTMTNEYTLESCRLQPVLSGTSSIVTGVILTGIYRGASKNNC